VRHRHSIVPGSHLWDLDREATPEETISAEMQAGSVLLWLGGTLHAAGPNVTADEWRRGVFISYSLGWLRTEENQYLAVPMEVADSLEPKMAELVRCTLHPHRALACQSSGAKAQVRSCLSERRSCMIITWW